MKRFAILALATLCLASWARLAAEPPSLSVAEGKVNKIEKDAISFQPRGTDGRYGKAITLKITGTSNLSIVSTQERAGKTVLVQRDLKSSDLKANQLVAVIYATASKGDPVLLAAVAQPAGDK